MLFGMMLDSYTVSTQEAFAHCYDAVSYCSKSWEDKKQASISIVISGWVYAQAEWRDWTFDPMEAQSGKCCIPH